jgi:hypothetical protein
MAYTDTISELLRQNRQNVLSGGTGLSSNQMEGALAGIYGSEEQAAQKRAESAAAAKSAEESLALQKSALKSQQTASLIGGVGKLAAGGLEAVKSGVFKDLVGSSATAATTAASALTPEIVGSVASGIAPATEALAGSQALADAASAAWYGSTEIGLGTVLPVLGVLGLGVGLLSSKDGGTVICTELCAQGYITKKQLQLEEKWVRERLSLRGHLGYLIWARPIVRAMKKHKWVCKILQYPVNCFLRACYHELYSFMPVDKMGACMIKYGVPFCEWVYRMKGGR